MEQRHGTGRRPLVRSSGIPEPNSNSGACVVITFILDVRFVDAPAGVKEEEGHNGFLHLPYAAVVALIFNASKIQPSLSLLVVYK